VTVAAGPRGEPTHSQSLPPLSPSSFPNPLFFGRLHQGSPFDSSYAETNIETSLHEKATQRTIEIEYPSSARVPFDISDFLTRSILYIDFLASHVVW
jgi:hypothetical protein